MSETFVTFLALGIIIVVQFLIIDSHLDRLEKKIDKAFYIFALTGNDLYLRFPRKTKKENKEEEENGIHEA